MARNAQITNAEKQYMKINSIKKQKHGYSYLMRQSSKGNVVNRALTSLHGGLHETTLTESL